MAQGPVGPRHLARRTCSTRGRRRSGRRIAEACEAGDHASRSWPGNQGQRARNVLCDFNHGDAVVYGRHFLRCFRDARRAGRKELARHGSDAFLRDLYRAHGREVDRRRGGGSDADWNLDRDGRGLRVAGSGGERQHGRDPDCASYPGGLCPVFSARLLSLQQYLRCRRRRHHQRAGRATTPVRHPSSPHRCGIHDGAGDARSRLSGCCMDFDGSVLLAGADVRSDRGSATAGLANCSFACAPGGHDCGNSHSVRAYLSDWHPDVR